MTQYLDIVAPRDVQTAEPNSSPRRSTSTSALSGTQVVGGITFEIKRISKRAKHRAAKYALHWCLIAVALPGMGVGKRLVEKAREFANSTKNITVEVVEADDGETAKGFWEAMGLKPDDPDSGRKDAVKLLRKHFNDTMCDNAVPMMKQAPTRRRRAPAAATPDQKDCANKANISKKRKEVDGAAVVQAAVAALQGDCVVVRLTWMARWLTPDARVVTEPFMNEDNVPCSASSGRIPRTQEIDNVTLDRGDDDEWWFDWERAAPAPAPKPAMEKPKPTIKKSPRRS